MLSDHSVCHHFVREAPLEDKPFVDAFAGRGVIREEALHFGENLRRIRTVQQRLKGADKRGNGRSFPFLQC
jgi:hypothetical protein